ncbi:hypothetical protein I6B53_03790 [Schaalia sp. 19OD2882]|uniref:hypothetical protein n=1 Tax=Schaalia sp. 19OD2882 TaxID=2794089 RepID=UPI001C1EEB18|nr:hypothetical protein [Schaalia sp. 19OD2882]QWW20229.1 hypothetical protein I6B53_03790 [Schaalia sp. 19OD2882]
MTSPQTLSDSQRRDLAAWVAECAEPGIDLVDNDPTARRRAQEALGRTRAFGQAASGPLGPGLLSRDVVGEAILALQLAIAEK